MKKVSFNREIYSENTIKQTMKIYHDYATMTVKFNDKQAEITFWKCKYDETQTINEFENYMIGLENS
jgi:hypothetical protein